MPHRAFTVETSRSSSRCHEFAVFMVALLLGTLPGVAHAQATDAASLGQRLGPAYARLVNLSASPDITAARYHVDTEPRLRLDVARIPVSASTHDLNATTALETRLVAGYVRLASEFPVSGAAAGRVDTRWVAYGLTAGLAARIAVTGALTVIPALDLGVAQFENRADYKAGAAPFQPLLDGTVFNWRSHAWLATPSAGVEWVDETEFRRIDLRAHLGWSRVATFGETDAALRFRRSGGAFSLRAEHTAPANWAWFGRSPAWVLLGGHTAFLGPDRGVLGFDRISEFGAGLEWPSRWSAESLSRLRATLSVLVGPDVRGLTASLGVDL